MGFRLRLWYFTRPTFHEIFPPLSFLDQGLYENQVHLRDLKYETWRNTFPSCMWQLHGC